MKHNIQCSLFKGKVISRVKFPLRTDQSIETSETYFYSKTCDPWSVKLSNVTTVILAYKCGQEDVQRETYWHLTACTTCNKWAECRRPSLRAIDQCQCLRCHVAFWDTQFVLSLPNEASAVRQQGVDFPSVLLLMFDVFICIKCISYGAVANVLYKWKEKWSFRDCVKCWLPSIFTSS